MKFRLIFPFLIFLFSCGKLDIKPRQSLVVPTTANDLQGLLNNTDILNSNTIVLGEIYTGQYLLSNAVYNSLYAIQHRNAYVFEKDVFNGVTLEAGWDYTYQKVFYANVVLKALESIDPADFGPEVYNDIWGQALFHRANSFFMLAQIFAKPFIAIQTTDLGIPLPLSADVHKKLTRSTLQETYRQITDDLIMAAALLPVANSYKTRPSRAAAFALLSRIYLAAEDYQQSSLYSDSCLMLANTLIDYNSLDTQSPYPISQFNEEVIFHATTEYSEIFFAGSHRIGEDLISLYPDNDLRKSIFYQTVAGDISFKGNYTGNFFLFGGLAVDEVYLNRAECKARNGDIDEALSDINTLSQNRMAEGHFEPVHITDPDNLLLFILDERKRQLPFRGIRWNDLRRLNRDNRFSETLIRTLNENTYTLPPNDNRYVFPIPQYIIAFNEIQQNP